MSFRFGLSVSVGENAGEGRYFGDPTPVLFTLDFDF
jgi:hypothetical protein